jgi:hypothetical protein
VYVSPPATPSAIYSTPVDTQAFNFLVLYQIRGKKCLVIDPKLAGTLSLILQTSVLKVRRYTVHLLSMMKP